LDFFKKLNPETKKKFNWTIKLISTLERIPDKYFKHITNSKSLYEIRVDVHSCTYRVFCFFDDGNVIILINGFQKKSQKVPMNEIKMAERLMKNYFEEKK
jgi:phage-related protein